MKILIRVAVGVAVLVMLALGALVATPRFVDWNGFKPQLAAAVWSSTGYTLRIDGDLGVVLFPTLRIRAGGIHVASAAAGMPEIASADRLALDAAFWPLLARRLEIDSLVLTKPAVSLAVDARGAANWTMAPSSSAPGAGGGWLTGVRLNAAIIEQGRLFYRDATTDQTLDARDVNLSAVMGEVTSPIAVKGGLSLNDQPVALDIALDSLGRLARGEAAKMRLAVDTKELRVHFDGSARRRPVPGLGGTFDMDVGSVGRLMAWLRRPLDKSQPDPGPLRVHAVFSSTGAKTTLENATVVAGAYKATAAGSLDTSGAVTKLALTVDSGAIDVDRYFPAAAKAPPRAARPAGRAPAKDLLTSLSDEPFDLGALRAIDADVRVTVAGIKAMGYEVGRAAFGATARGGRIAVDLEELALYGGDVKGTIKADATAKALALDAALNVNHVAVDRLARLAGGPAMSGALTATVTASSQGASPQALAASLRGRIAADLGGVRTAAAKGVSGLKLDVNLPGADQPTTVKGNLVYNGERIDIDATVGSSRQLLAADRFPAKVVLASRPVSLNYAGAIQRRPVGGLDGALDVDAPSAGRLLAWLGRPLDAKRPDPGALKLHADMTSDGARITLKDAIVTGKALKATVEARLDRSRTPGAFDATIDIQNADLNAYWPPAPSGKGGGWSGEPYDFSLLREANGTARIQFAALRYRDFDVTQGALKATVTNGALDLAVERLTLAHGTIGGRVAIDASGAVPKIAYQLTGSGLQARELMMTLANSGRLAGTLAFQTSGGGAGRSERDFVASLNGTGQFRITDGTIYGLNLAATLRQIGTLSFGGGQGRQTDFAELSGTFAIRNGVIENRDLRMIAPQVRVAGGGTAPIPPQTIDYRIEASLVGTPQTMGGSQALAGLPIPIRITGPWSNPRYDIDWRSVFLAMAADPARLAGLSADLSSAAKRFGVNLPIPGGGGVGTILQSIPGMPKGLIPPQSGQLPPQPSKPSLPETLKQLFGQ